MATGRMAEVEAEAVRNDGSQFPVRIRAFPLFAADGSPSGFIELVEDISKIKQTEGFLQRAKEAAEAANRAKSEFLANMSHEIRTPMTAILGFSDLLASSNLSTAERRNFLEGIRRNGTALLDLINDILDLSRIEANKIVLEEADCPLRQIIDDVVSVAKVKAEKKGLGLVVDYEWPLPATIHTDPMRLGQILANLVGNAVKFTDRGEVRLAVSCQLAEDGFRPHAIRDLGHRHRHPHREDRRDLPAFRAGGRVCEPSLRGHGPGLGHLQTPGSGLGRRY